jgi:hypothetical protein
MSAHALHRDATRVDREETEAEEAVAERGAGRERERGSEGDGESGSGKGRDNARARSKAGARQTRGSEAGTEAASDGAEVRGGKMEWRLQLSNRIARERRRC